MKPITITALKQERPEVMTEEPVDISKSGWGWLAWIKGSDSHDSHEGPTELLALQRLSDAMGWGYKVVEDQIEYSGQPAVRAEQEKLRNALQERFGPNARRTITVSELLREQGCALVTSTACHVTTFQTYHKGSFSKKHFDDRVSALQSLAVAEGWNVTVVEDSPKPTGNRYSSVEELIEGEGISQEVKDTYKALQTPRTDAEVIKDPNKTTFFFGVVSADFARTLEKELKVERESKEFLKQCENLHAEALGLTTPSNGVAIASAIRKLKEQLTEALAKLQENQK